MPESFARCLHCQREAFDALRYIARCGLLWWQMPHELPFWPAVYQQTRRWIEAGVFEEFPYDLCQLIRVDKRNVRPSVVMFGSAKAMVQHFKWDWFLVSIEQG